MSLIIYNNAKLERKKKSNKNLPKSKESQVSDVSVWVTFVIIVDAESVEVLIIVSLVEAVEEPITTTLSFGIRLCLFKGRNKQTDKQIFKQFKILIPYAAAEV